MAMPTNANISQSVTPFNQLVHSHPPPNFASTDGAILLASWKQEVSMDLWEPIASSGEVLPTLWRNTLGNIITRLHVTAPNVDTAAEAFIKWVRADFNSQQATLPPMVDIDPGFNRNNIFHSHRVWNM